MGYAEQGKEAYGTSCEWIGCGWNQGTCDVHHISYQEHQEIENHLRAYYMMNDEESFQEMQEVAYSWGYGAFNKKTRQLPKDDRIENLSVLCPNHHRFVHTQDMGMNIASYIPRRKKE